MTEHSYLLERSSSSADITRRELEVREFLFKLLKESVGGGLALVVGVLVVLVGVVRAIELDSIEQFVELLLNLSLEVIIVGIETLVRIVVTLRLATTRAFELREDCL